MKIKKVLEHTTSMLSCLVTFICASFIVGWLCYTKFYQWNSSDHQIVLTHITPKELDLANVDVVNIKTGFYINDFSKFNILESSFVIEGSVWFLFNAHTISIDSVEDFTFKKATFLKKVRSTIQLDGDKVFVLYDIKIEIAADLNFHYFPFDSHQVTFVLINQKTLPTDTMLESNHLLFSVSKNIYTSDWKIIAKKVDFGYEDLFLDKEKVISNPEVIFSLDFIRAGIRSLFIIFLPLFILYFLGLFSLIIDGQNVKELKYAMPTCIGSLSAFLMYRFVVENISPKVAYLTIVDKVYLFMLTILFSVFIINVLSIHLTERVNHQSLYTIRKGIFLLCIILLVGAVKFFLR